MPSLDVLQQVDQYIGETLPYSVDWSNEIPNANETISTSVWSGDGLTFSVATISGKACNVLISFASGPQSMQNYIAVNTVTTNANRTEIFKFKIRAI